ncbi:hypothetical protein PESP_b0289 [Pseudoalteromonas espejiana DSM 9414]|nr:hypothetical protein PESP_b0289 [Pseudoalteromonas espejiana DSM 9414]
MIYLHLLGKNGLFMPYLALTLICLLIDSICIAVGKPSEIT